LSHQWNVPSSEDDVLVGDPNQVWAYRQDAFMSISHAVC
jgi:hypothetical protein